MGASSTHHRWWLVLAALALLFGWQAQPADPAEPTDPGAGGNAARLHHQLARFLDSAQRGELDPRTIVVLDHYFRRVQSWQLPAHRQRAVQIARCYANHPSAVARTAARRLLVGENVGLESSPQPRAAAEITPSHSPDFELISRLLLPSDLDQSTYQRTYLPHYPFALTESGLADWSQLRPRVEQLAVRTHRELALLLWRPDGHRRPWQATQISQSALPSQPDPRSDLHLFRPDPEAVFAWRISDAMGGRRLLAAVSRCAQAGIRPDHELVLRLTALATLGDAAYRADDPELRQELLTLAESARGPWRIYLAMLAARAGVADRPELFTTRLLAEAETDQEYQWAVAALIWGGALEQETFSHPEQEALLLEVLADPDRHGQLRPPGPRQLARLRGAVQYVGSVELPGQSCYTGLRAAVSDTLRRLAPGLSAAQVTTWFDSGKELVTTWRPVYPLNPLTTVQVLDEYGFPEVAGRYLRRYDAEFWQDASSADAIGWALDRRERNAAGYSPDTELARLETTFRNYLQLPLEPYLDCLENERRLARGWVITRPIFTVPAAPAGIVLDGVVGDSEWAATLAIANYNRSETIALPPIIRLAYDQAGLLVGFTSEAGAIFEAGLPSTFVFLLDPDRSYRRFIPCLIPFTREEAASPPVFRTNPRPDAPAERAIEYEGRIPWSYLDRSGPPARGEIWSFNLLRLPYSDFDPKLTPCLKYVMDMERPGKWRIHLEQNPYLIFGASYPARPLPPPEPASSPGTRNPSLGWAALVFPAFVLVCLLLFRRRRNARRVPPPPPIPPPTGKE